MIPQTTFVLTFRPHIISQLGGVQTLAFACNSKAKNTMRIPNDTKIANFLTTVYYIVNMAYTRAPHFPIEFRIVDTSLLLGYFVTPLFNLASPL